MSGDLDLRAFNPVEPTTLQCLDRYYAMMRTEAPVHYVEAVDMYFVTRHDLICTVMRDTETFSSVYSATTKSTIPLPPGDMARLAAVQAAGYPRVPTLINADPPAHTRYRRLVSKAFSIRSVNGLEPLVRSTTTKLIDSWIDDDRIEFVGQFAMPLPMEVIAKALGVPDDRLADFKRWSDDTVAGFGANPSLDRRIEAEHGINELQHYFAEQLEQRRAHPRDDLLTHLLEARIDDDDLADTRPLDIAEVLGVLQQLLAGGNETTTKLLGAAMLLLANHPEHWEKLRSDPSVSPTIVEEALRLSSPAQAMRRIATRDLELDGVAIPKGARVAVVLASANRDAALFEHPDDFDPGRANLNEHLVFGKGVHFCPGASLTRLEGRVALVEFAQRLRSFSLCASNEFPYDPSFMLRGLQRLELDIVPA